jgi:hypothetical protein
VGAFVRLWFTSTLTAFLSNNNRRWLGASYPNGKWVSSLRTFQYPTNWMVSRCHFKLSTPTHYFYIILNRTFDVHQDCILSCLELNSNFWLTILSMVPTFHLPSTIFSTTLQLQFGTTPSFNHRPLFLCLHSSHWSFGYPFITISTWHWCKRHMMSSMILCIHCKGSTISWGLKTNRHFFPLVFGI